jgi:hypothetical protein
VIVHVALLPAPNVSPEMRTTSREFAGGVKLAVVAVSVDAAVMFWATAGDEASIASATTPPYLSKP